MSSRPLRALVLEDDPSWQQILGEILNDYGMQVDTCDTLDSAIEALRAHPYRLATIDLSLKSGDHANKDGLSALEAVKRYAPTCVAILLTGFASVELAVSALQDYGAYTCLRKENFRRSEFKELVDQAIAKATAIEAHPKEKAAATQKDMADQKRGEIAGGGSALLIEDDAGWRSLLSELLEEAGFEVQQCTSFGEAMGLLKRETYQLAVADLSLASSLEPEGNLDGYRLLAHTKQHGLATVVVSGFADPGLIEHAYTEHGIFACIEKQAFDRRAFFETVRQAAEHTANQTVLAALSERELEVLNLLVQGLTNKEIATRLFITTNTVKRHLKSIFAKLEVNTRSAASALAVQLGVGVSLGGSN